MATRVGWSPGPAAWKDDLTPIAAADWNPDRAAHLLSHAGFGGTPAEIETLANAGLEHAVRSLVDYERIPNPKMQPFVESGLWDPTLDRFPESRPEATDRAARDGRSMGIETKPGGNRPVQPVSDRFFYWLRATMLETRRLGYWWANRMLQTTHPVEQKMALLWHGHFATHENKVRDYRKMLQQIDLFERGATGNIRELTIQVAQNPAMLYFLDAQYNVKGAPNENFAREVMELFTMGVGNYSEQDVRECARAFTGWYFDNLAFKVDPDKHDGGAKTFLGRVGNFDGVDVLKIIFEQPVTAEYLAGKVYRFLVRDELSPDLRRKLGAVLRDHDYELKPLLTVIFSSKDFYSQASYGGHIKGPVEHLVAMLKHVGADAIPGVPDFNQATIAMGQHLLNPPSVAGWAGGKAWITPGLLIARGNVAREVLDPRHDRLQGLELHGRQRRRARPAAPRRLRHRRGDGRERSLEDDHLRPGRARAGRTVQHPHLGLRRLAAGRAEAHPHATPGRAVRTDSDGARRVVRRLRRKRLTICCGECSVCRRPRRPGTRS